MKKGLMGFMWAFAVFVSFLLSIAVSVSGAFAGFGLSPFAADMLGLALAATLPICVSLLAIRSLGLWELAGLARGDILEHGRLYLIPTYLLIVGLFQFDFHAASNIAPSDIGPLAIAKLAGGMTEEFVFRGVFLSLFIYAFVRKGKNLLLAVVLSSLVFGCLHLINLTHVSNVPRVIGQVVYAVFFGVFFGALLLKTKKLLPLGILHGVINFVFALKDLPGYTGKNTDAALDTASLSAQISDAMMSCALILPLFIAGLLILRTLSMDELAGKVPTSKG